MHGPLIAARVASGKRRAVRVVKERIVCGGEYVSCRVRKKIQIGDGVLCVCMCVLLGRERG